MEPEQKMRRVLDLARDEIIRLDTVRAREYLKEIGPKTEEHKGTATWAEHALLSADALAAAGDPDAESEFDEAHRRIFNPADRDSGLEMRFHDDFAKYLASFPHCRSRARQHNQSAATLALKLGLLEDKARLDLRIIKIDLETDEDRTGIASLQKLKQVAREIGASYQRQLAVWFQYRGESHENVGLLAARGQGAASVDYFRGLFASIR